MAPNMGWKKNGNFALEPSLEPPAFQEQPSGTPKIIFEAIGVQNTPPGTPKTQKEPQNEPQGTPKH